MKKYTPYLIICLFLLWGCNPKPANQYKVVKVKDGDTLGLLSNDNQEITVRLAEIDCPEKSQAFGKVAKKFTSDICFGKEVTLIGNAKDRYGRTVALVILPDGTNVNYQLVKNGFAWQYKAYSQSAELASLEQNARENKLGLWQDANPTPPWEYRKEGRSSGYDNNPYKKHYKRKPKLEDVY